MKLNLPKEWFVRRADLEANHEVGAGSPPATPSNVVSISSILTHLAFGRFVLLQRRKLHLSLEDLATRAETDVSELRAIEDDPYHEPEPSTVYGLATTFGLPPKQLLKAANLVEAKSSRISEEALRFAASAKPAGPLSADEQHALEVYVSTLLSEETAKEG